MAMTTHSSRTQPGGVNRDQLFVARCFALAVSAGAFAVIGDILATLKTQFILSNLQIGYIGGAGVWSFTISIMIFGPPVHPFQSPRTSSRITFTSKTFAPCSLPPFLF